jgi:ubiquinone/menaquinone biosynthesis C-methylase UbiE
MMKLLKKILLMDEHLCPWWLAYTFDNPIRRLFHKPEKIFKEYLSPGMTAIDIGCGMGFFSVGMAHLVGKDGHVISVDIQQQMLNTLKKRAFKAGVADRIELHKSLSDKIGLSTQADFILTFWMAHEVPDIKSFFAQMHALLKDNGKYMLTEPAIHVSASRYREISGHVSGAGFKMIENPTIAFSRATVYEK